MGFDDLGRTTGRLKQACMFAVIVTSSHPSLPAWLSKSATVILLGGLLTSTARYSQTTDHSWILRII